MKTSEINRLKEICYPPRSTSYPPKIKEEWYLLTKSLSDKGVIKMYFNGNGFTWNTPHGDDIEHSEEYKFMNKYEK